MSDDAVKSKFDDWVAATFDVDPGAYKQASAPSSHAAGGLIDDLKYAATTVENVVGDAWSETKIKAEEIEQTIEGGMDKLVELGGKAVDAAEETVEGLAKKASGSEPPKPPAPTGPITLTHQTEARKPANRARTKLGVGEKVTLTVSPGPGKWDASGAKLSAKTGSTVTMTAPPRPGSVEVTVEVGTTKQTVTFDVIAPTTVHMDRIDTEHYGAAQLGTAHGLPNAGFHAHIYLGPDDVNFAAVSFREDEIGAKASGSWKSKNGEGHSPNPAPLPCTDNVVSGKGTETTADDHCWTGYVPDLDLTDWTGQMSWSIPWHWSCGSGRGLIGRIVQQVNTTKDGSTTISKGGASYTAPLD